MRSDEMWDRVLKVIPLRVCVVRGSAVLVLKVISVKLRTGHRRACRPPEGAADGKGGGGSSASDSADANTLVIAPDEKNCMLAMSAAAAIASKVSPRFRTWPITEAKALEPALRSMGLRVPAAEIDGTAPGAGGKCLSDALVSVGPAGRGGTVCLHCLVHTCTCTCCRLCV